MYSMEDEIKRTKELNDKYEQVYNEKYAGKDFHEKPSPETRERLSTLETTQKFMVQEISEIKEIVKEIRTNLVEVMECKAEKTDVESLKNKYETLNNFMWKSIGVSLVAVVVFGTLATLLINHLLGND